MPVLLPTPRLPAALARRACPPRLPAALARRACPPRLPAALQTPRSKRRASSKPLACLCFLAILLAVTSLASKAHAQYTTAPAGPYSPTPEAR
jgi:hypothetical protein